MRQFICAASRTIIVFMGSILLSSVPVHADNTDGWTPFLPKSDPAPGAIGMADWLDAPAGKHGFVKMDGDRFIFEDGTPVKFWGVNLQFMSCAPKKEDATAWAKWHAKYGVNCVRIFKFMRSGDAWVGGIVDKNDATEFVPEKADRFDFLCAELKKNGIYYGFEPVAQQEIRPGDLKRMIAPGEVEAVSKEMYKWGNIGRLLVYIAEDVQDLKVEMFVKLLQRKNPYTGLTYADDPALAYIEILNEDSIFWKDFAKFNTLTVFPTYKERFVKKYSEWLRKKYGSHENLVQSWGERALNAFEEKNEHLDKNNIMVQGDMSLVSSTGMQNTERSGRKRRMLDNAEFLFEVQRAYHAKVKDAIRGTGYKGALIGGNWIGAPGVPHYLNLMSDAEAGFIDRHIYFAATHGAPKTGPFDSRSQLDDPKSSMLIKGMEQVKNRPFCISEWNTGFPNEWILESGPLMAAYGMGLQGWDASFNFTSRITTSSQMFASNLVTAPEFFLCDYPNQTGLYPILARMVFRGDIREASVISHLKLSRSELLNAEPDWIGFERQGKASGDGNADTVGLVPPAALAIGKTVVEFVNEPAKSTFPDVAPHISGGTMRALTGQLAWYNGNDALDGYFTIDTDATKAAVGFLPGGPIVLGDISIDPKPGFAGIFLTCREQNATIRTSKTLLLAALARIRNTGMEFSKDGKNLLAFGEGPILIEPVKAEITIRGREIATIWALDHDGIRTDLVLPSADGKFTIDGTADKAFYYEIELKVP